MTMISSISQAPVSPILENSNDGSNFIMRMQELVCKIMEQLGKMSDKNRNDVDTLKREFREVSSEAANLQMRIGNAAPWISGIALVVCSAQIFTAQELAPIIQFVSGQIPPAASVYTSHLQAEQMGFQATGSLKQTEISTQSQKSQSEAEVRQAILGLLNSMLEVLKKSSS